MLGWKEVTRMESFNFGELFAFLQTSLGMILSFMAGRQSAKPKKKSRPRSKERGSKSKKK